MTENEFISYFGKDIKVLFKDGAVLIGHVVSYTWAVDNDPVEEAEIDLKVEGRAGLVAITQKEVKSIEIIK
ncbi:MAG: hypothetical protein ACI4MN_05970 [Candidatus Coproplasma sp.]